MNQPSVECLYAVPGLRLKLRIVGRPESQPAPRFHHIPNGRTFLYNAAEPQQNQLRNLIRFALQLDDGVLFFPPETNVMVELLHFFIPRPGHHFLSHRSRCFGNLKQQFKNRRIPVGKKPDIDNLEKFLFDSLEGVIFDDDKHIVQINEASKFYDSSGECKGSTIVKIVSVYDFQNRKANGMDKKAGVTSSAVVDILDK